MNPTQGDEPHRKTERLQVLKARAQAVLQGSQPIDERSRADDLQTSNLLEDLRIYQVELELQNEELRAAQLAAELAQRTYQTLFEQMPLAALVLDTQGLVDACNGLAAQLLGIQGQLAPLDASFWRRLVKQDRSRLHVALRDVMPGQAQLLERLQLLTHDVPSGVFDAHLIGLSMDYKLDRRVLMLLVDRSVEQARERDRRLYDALLDATENPVSAFDNGGHLLLANQAMLNAVQRPRDRVLGQPRESFMSLRDAIVGNEADQKVLQTGMALTVEELTLPAQAAKRWTI